MEEFETSVDTREAIKEKLRQNFDGKIVRKDLTKKIKEGANVPTYVLEFLLGQYCSTDDDEIVQKGVETVKRILADNYVRPDESEKVLSRLRQRGSMTIIDQVTVELNLKYDFSVKISIPLENTGVSSVFATSVWPFSLIFSLARRNEGNFFQAVPTTLSSSLAEVRLASLVAWA